MRSSLMLLCAVCVFLLALVSFCPATEEKAEGETGEAQGAEQSAPDADAAPPSLEREAAWLKERLFTWDLWHTELARDLGDNSLDDAADAGRTLSAAKSLQAGMKDEPAAAFDGVVAAYEKVASDVATPGLPVFRIRALSGTLDRIKRDVRKLAVPGNLSSEKISAQKGEEEGRADQVVPFHRDPGGETKQGRSRYVASSRGDLYHRVTCPEATQLHNKDRIYFQSRKQAEDAGYRPHRACIYGM